jgi:hypothetical protein
MPDTASYASVTIDRQQRAPARCTPERLQATDVLRFAGFVYLVPPGDVICRPVPKGLKAANRALLKYRCPPKVQWRRKGESIPPSLNLNVKVCHYGRVYVVHVATNLGLSLLDDSL